MDWLEEALIEYFDTEVEKSEFTDKELANFNWEEVS